MKITGKTKLLGFFANPAEHSQSPLIYNTSFDKLGIDYVYLAFNIPEGKIGDAVSVMKTLEMRGANVSMPHKQAIIPYLDEVSAIVATCDAVNTVINDNGFLKGYNTDIVGSTKAIESMGVNIEGVNAVILGLGGAGKAVLTALAMKKAGKVTVFVRGKNALLSGEADHSYRAADAMAFVDKIKRNTGVDIEVKDEANLDELKEALSTASLLVNCTAIGMGKHEGMSLIPDSSYLHSNLSVMDAIYYPKKSKLLEQAEEAGCNWKNGIDMLLYQGQEAFKLLTGKDFPIDAVRAAFNR